MIRGRYLTSMDARSEVFMLRRRVFTEELGYPKDAEPDAHDARAVYALVYDEDGAPAATGRLYIDGDRFFIGRVCVLSDRRGRGLGDFAVRMLISRALELNAPSVHAWAPDEALGFFERFGFKASGEAVGGDGRAHWALAMPLDEGALAGACGGAGCANCENTRCGGAHA